MKAKSIRRASILAGILLLFLNSVAAEYTPGELIVKLRQRPRRNTLDEITRTGSATLDGALQSASVSLTEPLREFRSRFDAVDRVVKLRLVDASRLDSLEFVLASDPDVEWVTRNYHYRTVGSPIDYIPNDSLFAGAWWLPVISAPLAWDLTRGDSSLVMGVIDTGVDYLHPDLAGNIWHNRADANNDGVDDDNNGFIDDGIGWDFVDAPGFPAAGDYLDRDNDPMDELGHGTYVGGIACAVSDNETCYPSIGFNCRIMCLRAGNSSGLLEEDDAAAAILYGAANGAQVINMSFGDVVASPLLRETCRIAYEQGVVLVSSAGNANSEAIHYPSGFPEVISVGATNQVDQRASFSNYGPSVDVMAPGSDIVSTILGGECGVWDFPFGTSYASPMVGATALLALSVNPSLTPADILDIVKTSADDMDQPGWDNETVHGRLNVRRAVEMAQYGSDVVARIHSPYTDEGISEDFTVVGEVWGAAFQSFSVKYGLGENPGTWAVVATGHERHYGDELAVIPVPEVDTVMVVRLEASGVGGLYSIDHAHLFVQRTAPVIDSVVVARLLDEDTYADLVHVWSNQTSRGSMLLTNASDSVRQDFGYVSDEHVGLLTAEQFPGPWTVQVRLENLAGLSTISEPFDFLIDSSPFSSNEWIQEATALPHGLISDFRSDFNCNGLPEIWYLPILSGGILDTLQPREWNGSAFVDMNNRYGLHLPQAYGDADGDGLMEMMGRRFTETRIWEQETACGPLNQVAFESGDGWEEFLGGAFLDLNESDGHGELIARVGTTGGSRYVVYSVLPGYALSAVDTLANLSDGGNSLGPPSVVMSDVDNDERFDFLYGDYDGDIVFCEYDGGEIVQRWSMRLPINDATDWLAAGDIDGDGMTEFVAGCRSNSAGGTESQRRSQHWEYFIFEAVADNEFAITDSIFILGNENISDYPATISIGDVNGDQTEDILISAFPDLYIISYNSSSGKFVPLWHYKPSMANNLLIADFDGDGLNEFFFSDGMQIRRVEAASASGERPHPPVSLSGEPTGPTSIRLSWTSVAEADSYLVYRSPDGTDFSVIGSVQGTSLNLSDLTENLPLRYAVASVDNDYPTPVSVFSNIVSVTANSAPTVEDTAAFVEPNYVLLSFSEPMGGSALVQGNYRMSDERMPSVISPHESGRAIYLTFDGNFVEGWYQLELRDLRDAQGSRLPNTMVVFEVTRDGVEAPHIVSHSLRGDVMVTEIEITYSQAMSATALDRLHYRIDYGRDGAPEYVEQVEALTSDRGKVLVRLPASHPVGALGLSARMLIRGVESESGISIDTTSGQADLRFGGAASNLDEAYVFPNPYRGIGAGGGEGVNFAGLPEHAMIRVFTIHGVLVKEIEHSGFTGAANWDLRNDGGEEISAGVYLYVIESDGDEVRGKLAVMR